MAVITRDMLAEHLYANINMTRADAKSAVALMVERITQALVAGDEVQLRGFGVFFPRAYPPRPGRNPQTGEDAEVPARVGVLFRAGKHLRDQVNGKTGLVVQAEEEAA